MKNREWVAFSCILGVMAGLALTNTGADDREAFLLWLLYAVTCGTVVNTATGLRSVELLNASWPSPASMALAVIFRTTFQGAAYFSGQQLTHTSFDYLWISVVFALSWAAIWVFAHARPAILHALRALFGMPQARAQRIEKRLNWVIKIVGLVVLLGHRILG